MVSRRDISRALSFGNIGAIYVWLLIIVIFSYWLPDVFPAVETIRAVGRNYATAGLAALAILLPMASGAFDASVGGTMSLTSVVCAYLLINTGLPVWVIVLMTLCVGAAVGLFNAFAVVSLRIPSLIATLATWLIANSLSVAVSGNRTISSERVSGDSFTQIARLSWNRFPAPIFYVIAITIILGIVMSHTTGGRYLYAVGYNPQVARLAGVRVKRVQAVSLIAAGVLAAFAGIILTARLSSATPRSGDPYLLPAFAAAFLGATQFKAKRFNAAGTIIAVYMLGTGQYGLLLAGVPTWIPNIFQGTALIAAIGLTQLQDQSRPRIRKSRSLIDPSEAPGAVAAQGESTPTDPLDVETVPLK